jgi:hypothetical protein
MVEGIAMGLFLKKPALAGTNNIAGGPTDVSPWYVPVVSGTGYNGDFVAFTTATPFTGLGVAMAVGHLYVFTATADCWIRQSTNATVNAATKGAASMFVQKGIQILIDGAQGSQLSVLQDATGGNASLIEVTA